MAGNALSRAATSLLVNQSAMPVHGVGALTSVFTRVIFWAMESTYTAFGGLSLIATGGIEKVALAAREWFAGGADGSISVFKDETGEPVDLDLRGESTEVLARLDDHPIVTRPTAEFAPHNRKVAVSNTWRVRGFMASS